jgi:hypothetical protein
MGDQINWLSLNLQKQFRIENRFQEPLVFPGIESFKPLILLNIYKSRFLTRSTSMGVEWSLNSSKQLQNFILLNYLIFTLGVHLATLYPKVVFKNK